MPGNKMHEHQVGSSGRAAILRIGQEAATGMSGSRAATPWAKAAMLGTDNPRGISRRGMNQESRDHNKHNSLGQSGHKPARHSTAQEKH
jgi:hypothetical protein